MTKRLFGIVLMMMLMTTLSLKVYAGPVTVKGGITNGTVAVDKATANPGETVTITVTPANGFYAEKSDVKAEKTIDGGSAQAPGLKAGNPGVGSFVDIQGDAPADISGVATYTFTMPEAPYGVQVSAEFHECTPITQAMFNSIAEQEFTGQQITPAVQCSDGYNLVLGTDYTVEYGENVGPGMNAGTVTITGKNKYTGTALLYFTIFRETYEIRWGQGNPWDSQHVIAMTLADGGKWVAANQEMAATSEFKVVKKREAGETTDTWYGAPGNDNYWINAGTLNTEIQLYEGNQNLYFPNSGTYTFTFDPATNKLVVSGEIIYNVTVADGIQNGTVVANPTSGKAGDQITITATPAEGYKLNSLSINGEPAAADENEDGTYTYVLTMPAADVTITAEFSKKLYNITKAETENGSFNISMTSGFMGDFVEIYPEPADGYTVDQVTVTAQDGTQVQVENMTDRYRFTMPASNVTVAVTFRALTISYEIRWGQGTPWAQENVIPMLLGDDGKWVAASQSMAATSEFKVVKKVQDGDNEPTLTWLGAQADGMYWITADNLGSEISLYENTPNLYFPKTGVYTFTFDPSKNILVVTGDILYNVTVADGIQNGTVVANPTSGKAGDLITLTVTPQPGYELETLTCTTEGGEPVTIENNQFVMPAANVTINATFKEIEYHYSAVEQVKCVVVDAAGFAHEGQTITMRVVPDSGTQFKQALVYKVSGHAPNLVEEPIEFTVTQVEGSTKDVDLSFVMPAGEVEVHVICADAYSVTVNAGENGSAQVDKIVAVAGETVTVTTYPNQEYKVDEIYYTYTIEGTSNRVDIENGDNGYTFTMPAADVLVVVTFKSIFNSYVLNYVGAPTGGTVAVTNGDNQPINPGDAVAELSTVIVTVTPNEGYELETVEIKTENDESVNVEVVDGAYRFIMPSSNTTIIVTFKAIEYELEGVTFTADRQWATYYNGTKNLALPQGVKAYIVNSVINDAVDITEIGYIPAGVGVLLYSENVADQVMTIAYTGETGSYTSLLVGSDEAQTITAGYVLYNNNFIRSEAGTVAAHRCYLPATQVAGAPRILKIGLGDVPTAIESIIAQGNVAGIKYVNINGMTSNEPFRGINIAVITFTDGTTRTVKVVK
ncbi:MAG: hypothetical protein IJG81_06595 [Muribaculaceae bacterium]|nr:hypothetical protein [Muribaculaceae bacterium]